MLEVSCNLFHRLLLDGKHRFGELLLIGLPEGVKEPSFLLMFGHLWIVAFEELQAIDNLLETIQEVLRGHLGWLLDVMGEIIHLRLAHVRFSTALVAKYRDRILESLIGAVTKRWISWIHTMCFQKRSINQLRHFSNLANLPGTSNSASDA
jgi:hypothetical protein